jgi:hypothetical protein
MLRDKAAAVGRAKGHRRASRRQYVKARAPANDREGRPFLPCCAHDRDGDPGAFTRARPPLSEPFMRHPFLFSTTASFIFLASRLVFAADETTTTPAPPPPAHFGAAQTLAISSDATLGFSYSSSESLGTVTDVNIHPAFDYFVIRGLSIGGTVNVNISSQDIQGSTFHSYTLGTGPRLGVAIPLGERVALWPRVETTINSMQWSDNGGESMSASVRGSVPVIIEAAPHFDLGFGPYLQRTAHVGGNWFADSTNGGVQLTVGGWL